MGMTKKGTALAAVVVAVGVVNPAAAAVCAVVWLAWALKKKGKAA